MSDRLSCVWVALFSGGVVGRAYSVLPSTVSSAGSLLVFFSGFHFRSASHSTPGLGCFSNSIIVTPVVALPIIAAIGSVQSRNTFSFTIRRPNAISAPVAAGPAMLANTHQLGCSTLSLSRTLCGRPSAMPATQPDPTRNPKSRQVPVRCLSMTNPIKLWAVINIANHLSVPPMTVTASHRLARRGLK